MIGGACGTVIGSMLGLLVLGVLLAVVLHRLGLSASLAARLALAMFRRRRIAVHVSAPARRSLRSVGKQADDTKRSRASAGGASVSAELASRAVFELHCIRRCGRASQLHCAGQSHGRSDICSTKRRSSVSFVNRQYARNGRPLQRREPRGGLSGLARPREGGDDRQPHGRAVHARPPDRDRNRQSRRRRDRRNFHPRPRHRQRGHHASRRKGIDVRQGHGGCHDRDLGRAACSGSDQGCARSRDSRPRCRYRRKDRTGAREDGRSRGGRRARDQPWRRSRESRGPHRRGEERNRAHCRRRNSGRACCRSGKRNPTGGPCRQSRSQRGRGERRTARRQARLEQRARDRDTVRRGSSVVGLCRRRCAPNSRRWSHSVSRRKAWPKCRTRGTILVSRESHEPWLRRKVRHPGGEHEVRLRRDRKAETWVGFHHA